MMTLEDKNMKPKRSLRKAVDLFCKRCIVDKHGAGKWRLQVENCTSVTCPLYHYRPMSKLLRKPPERHHFDSFSDHRMTDHDLP